MLARVSNNTIVEVLVPVNGFSVQDCFHPDLLAGCIPLPEGAGVGWTQQEDGSWAAPVVPETPAE